MSAAGEQRETEMPLNETESFDGALITVDPNPTFFQTGKASEPYSRGQWDSALKATPHSPKGDVWYVGALSQLHARLPTASSLAVLAHC
jgi:hypothetical protein